MEVFKLLLLTRLKFCSFLPLHFPLTSLIGVLVKAVENPLKAEEFEAMAEAEKSNLVSEVEEFATASLYGGGVNCCSS